ncbi:MAG TPA: [citrate (pro-3S)-lyase] ligase [Desulfosporosinus sp.]|nr:[citrate (pro-3S)-lyase] ligase [Desulfosporosinus sp.]
MYGVNTERVDLKNPVERAEVEGFLQGFKLGLDRDVDYTIIIRDSASHDPRIVATCSKAKSVLKCFAVREELEGEGITSLLISTLIDKLFEEGIFHSFIFTKPAKARIFSALNFKLIHSNADVALLENGIYDIHQAIEAMENKYSIGEGEKTALVMNCNPFTLGHYYLIEEAAKKNQQVLVFIVEEDQSLFPFAVRYELVCKGVAHLKNVQVLPSGVYIISSVTFPSYFIKEEGERLRAYAELDASIFGKYFCSRFNITKRYIGEEPYSPVTAVYNEQLKKVLPTYGVEVHEIPRKAFGDVPISASSVRNIIKVGDAHIQELNHLLPQVTLEFLNSYLGREIVETLKISDSPN